MVYYNNVMIFIVGLGNPGKTYERTWHNAGFLVLDALIKEYGFPAFKLSKKHASLVSQGILGSTKAVLAKPQTFMNKSGISVRSLLKQGGELIVVHDDIDIPLGTVKISKDRGSAGHKGVESIMKELKSKDFTRIRIGIQPLTGKPKSVEDFVLQKFSPKELTAVQDAIQEAAGAIARTI